MAISSYKCPKVWTYYDSERRERRGILHYYINWWQDPEYPTGEYFDCTNASLNTFHIDLTNNIDWITIGEYANGVKFQIRIDSYTMQNVYLAHTRIQYRVLSVNASEISGDYYTLDIDTRYIENADVTRVLMYVLPDYVHYYTTDGIPLTGKEASEMYLGFLCLFCRWRSEGDYQVPNTSIRQARFYELYQDLRIGVNGLISSDAALKAAIDRLVDAGDGTIITPILPSEDISGEGGGDAANPDYNPFSDSINFPDLPMGGSALASGFIKLYRPTSSELNQLASKLWSDSFIEEIKKIQNDPLEAIISLHSVPFGIVGASRQNCRIGNYDSEIAMDTIGAQFYTVDCGNISIPEHWASALDYAPYTDIEIYLPFCGVKPLQIDDVMNRVLNVKYNIDILTGAAICMVKCGDSVLYTYNTEIAQNIPISASNHAQLYQSIISAASAVVGVASGGAGAVVGAVQSAATVAASKHSQVSRGGSLGGSVGVLGDFVPYLIIHRPIQSLAADFAHKKGYPSNITATLSRVSGYTEVDSIHLENIPCTDMEREELLRILQEGVIL